MATASFEQALRDARLLARQKDFAGSIALYRSILAQQPDSLEAHEGLAMVAFLAQDYPLAIEEFTRLSQLDPLQARHLVNLGAVFNRSGNHHKATEALRKAIQRDRKSADAYYNLGIAHRRLNQMPLAISAYKEAIRLNPQFAEAYQNLGNVYADMNNTTLAVTNFKKALEIRPDFEKARIGLEHAEDAAREAKANLDPLQRIASMDSTSIRLPMATQVELTPAERLNDRATVRRLADELHAITVEMQDFLKHRLQPAILDLERETVQGDFASISYLQAAREVSTTVDAWLGLRARMQRKLLELKHHEEQIGQ